jgi:hypothetical protein
LFISSRSSKLIFGAQGDHFWVDQNLEKFKHF